MITGIITGILAGFVASKLTSGHGKGCIVNLIVGIIGGAIGGWVFSLFGIQLHSASQTIAEFITAVVGSIILLWIINKLMK